MNILRWVALAGGGLLAAGVLKTAQPELFRSDQNSYTAKCRAIDGDTLNCLGTRIRLLGIDAAEMPGHCRDGRACAPGDPYEQRKILARFAGQDLTIAPLKFDRYGRTVATVTNAQGEDASCAMLKAGVRYMPEWDERKRVAIACASDVISRKLNENSSK